MTYFNAVVDANLRSGAYYVAHAQTRCHKCRRTTRVAAIALPLDHETLEADCPDDGDGQNADLWQDSPFPAWVFHINDVLESARQRLCAAAPGFAYVRTKPREESYWANHCEHCRTRLDDYELHCEPGGAFMPTSSREAAEIRLESFSEPIEIAAAGYSVEPELFAFMQQR